MRSYGQFSRLRLSSLLPKKFLEPIRLLRWLVAGVMSFIIVFLPLDYFESYLYDLRVVLRPTPPISPIIETILIDLPSVQKNKGMPTLLDHIHFLQQLKTENPRAIVYLINPAELQGSDEEKKSSLI